jgi:hypothetical protein
MLANINLRNAAAVQSAIIEKIKEKRNELRSNTEIWFNVWDHDTVDFEKVLYDRFVENEVVFADVSYLETILVDIRTKVGALNSSTRINELLALRNTILMEIQFLKELVSRLTPSKSNEEIKKILEFSAKRDGRDFHNAVDRQSFSVYSQKEIDLLKNRINNRKKELQDISDKLISLNLSHEITLSSEMAEFLKFAKIL